MKKTIYVLFSCICLTSINSCKDEKKKSIILFTGDANCYAEQVLVTNVSGDDSASSIGYKAISSLKNEYISSMGNDNVLLVDAGNHLEGRAIGSLSKGEDIVKIMNNVKYDVASVGYKDFSFGINNLIDVTKMASYEYVSSNLLNNNDENILKPYVIKDIGEWKIAFLGIISPNITKLVSPKYFKDDNNEFIYHFGGENIDSLSKKIQDNVDKAKKDGANFVVALTNLENGNNEFSYDNIISKTHSIDILINSNFATSNNNNSFVVPFTRKIKNLLGDNISFCQSSPNLENIGIIKIDEGGYVEIEFISNYLQERESDQIEEIDNIIAKSKELSEQVVAKSNIPLIIEDNNTKKRRIRKGETNLGNLIADSLQYNNVNNDFGIINGGDIKSSIAAGNICVKDILNTLPYLNLVSTYKCKGQTILDALEYSVSKLKTTTNLSTVNYNDLSDEFDGFLQVSNNMTYRIDTTVDSPVIIENNAFSGIDTSSKRRISNVKIKQSVIDPSKYYQFTSIPYLIEEGGNGYNMFKMNENTQLVKRDTKFDYQVLLDYLSSFGVINNYRTVPTDYENVEGNGRIVFYKG